MRIGELATRTGVSARSLRYYEAQGLLTSTRSTQGQRHYPAATVDRVALLRHLFAAGLSSRTIATLLPCVDTPGEPASDAALAVMRGERDRLTAEADALLRSRDALDEAIATNLAHRAELAAAAGQLLM